MKRKVWYEATFYRSMLCNSATIHSKPKFARVYMKLFHGLQRSVLLLNWFVLSGHVGPYDMCMLTFGHWSTLPFLKTFDQKLHLLFSVAHILLNTLWAVRRWCSSLSGGSSGDQSVSHNSGLKGLSPLWDSPQSSSVQLLGVEGWAGRGNSPPPQSPTMRKST